MSDNEIRTLNDEDAYKEIEQYITALSSGAVIDILNIACALNIDEIQTHRICMKILSNKTLLAEEII